MKTLLHETLDLERKIGLLSSAEYIEAYGRANFLFSIPFEMCEGSARVHERRFQDAAQHLSHYGPLVTDCDHHDTIESPRWQLGKALRGICPESGMAPLSQLEAVILWMSFVQEKKLPLSHYVSRDGHRMLVWDSKPIQYNAYATNGKMTEQYHSVNHLPVFDAKDSSYLPAYYTAAVAWKTGHRAETRKLLEGVGGFARQDPYVLELSALALIGDGTDSSVYRKAALMLVRAVEKFPKPETFALLVELLILGGNFDFAKRILDRAIRLTLHEQSWACKLYTILARVCDAAGDMDEATDARELARGNWRPIIQFPF